jgi:hypothetical protein
VPIANAIQRGSTVYVYNEKNQQIFVTSAGYESGDGLKGYTGASVNIQRGSTIYTYDEKGRQTSVRSAR